MPPGTRAVTSAWNDSASAGGVDRIASASSGHWVSSSVTRSRALPRVRTRSAVATTPSTRVMIGLIASRPPIAAWAPLIRPPFFRYSSVSSATNRSRSTVRRASVDAISAPEAPAAASSTPSSASRPSPMEAEALSTTWTSRASSISAPSRALLIVPDRRSPTVTHTTESAPSAKARS